MPCFRSLHEQVIFRLFFDAGHSTCVNNGSHVGLWMQSLVLLTPLFELPAAATRSSSQSPTETTQTATVPLNGKHELCQRGPHFSGVLLASSRHSVFLEEYWVCMPISLGLGQLSLSLVSSIWSGIWPITVSQAGLIR